MPLETFSCLHGVSIIKKVRFGRENHVKMNEKNILKNLLKKMQKILYRSYKHWSVKTHLQ